MKQGFLRILELVALVLFALIAPLPVLAAPVQGQLLKLACPANPGTNDPCKAVYYYGADGKRHAFPNDKVYFTWYADFSSVQTVAASALSAIPLGSNVTYRPGTKLVKFTTLNRVYAISLDGELHWITTETLAQDLYGPTWNKQVDDISDVFFTDYRLGSDIAAVADYDKTSELAEAQSINDDLDSTSRSLTVVTDRGNFAIDLVTLNKDRFQMITDTAETADCQDDCPTKTLAAFAQEAQATIGIHGAYFCPPDYTDCAGKTNTFLVPVYNSLTGTMLNASSLEVHDGPMIASTKDNAYLFFHRTKDFGSSVSDFESRTNTVLQAALANYPSLIENGQIVVETEDRLAKTNPTVQSVRGGIGFNDHSIFLVVAKKATVIDLASIMQKIGATNALNLDGGGSTALLYSGSYIDGPGRTLPTAILFKPL